SQQTASDLDLQNAQWHSPGDGVPGRRVELTRIGGLIALRDSERPNGPYLTFDTYEWDAFVYGALRGEFDSVELAP
ncbi:MAG: DUF397 domain-containing protein, partial [Mycobacteriales bacterium]